jgi:CO/xanthine dehydrogenase FAD-binding subunit
VVGSLVHADPAAELPAVLAVLGGSVRVARWDGPAAASHADGGAAASAADGVPPGAVVRDGSARDFFTGPMESAVQPGELAVSAYFPALGPRTGAAFEEVARRHGDYALAGVCAVVTLDEDGRVAAARVACVGVGPVPVVVDMSDTGRMSGTMDVRTRDVSDAGGWAEAVRVIRDETEPEGDIHASAAYRRHLVGVLAERALRTAAREAETGGA